MATITSFDDATAKIAALPLDPRGRVQWAKHPIETAAFVAAYVAAPKRPAWLAASARVLGVSRPSLSRAVHRFARGETADGKREWPELRAELVRLGVLLPRAAPPPRAVGPREYDPASVVASVGGVPLAGFARAEPRPSVRREVIAAGADLVVTETRVLAYGTPEHKAALIEALRGLKIGTAA